jgi:hypothetical protein
MRPMPRQTYSNENFDRAQHIAIQLADERRAAGRVSPAYGYAREDFEDAERILSESVLSGRI